MSLSKILSLLLFLTTWLCGWGQFNLGFQLFNDVPVLVGADSLKMPWAGGLNNPQFSALDVDSGQQGVFDIFTYDRDGGMRKAFIFDENSGQYQWLPYAEKSFPKITERGFCQFRDYDGDGKPDMFASFKELEFIMVYRNVSDSILKFEKVEEKLKFKITGSPVGNLAVNSQSVPVIEDFNGDGDLDIMQYMTTLKGTDCGVFVLFENQSMENYGVPDSLEFFVTNKCWGKLAIGGGLPGWRNYDCDTTCNANDAMRSDIAITQAAHDINGDGSLDLLLSYTHDTKLHAYTNTGNNTEGWIDLSVTDETFPSSGTPVNIQNMPVPYFMDVDHDGNDDMIAACNQFNTLTNEQDTAQATFVDDYYRNIGSASSPNFQLTKSGFLSGEMIDVGLRSMPTLADLNGDGLLDMVVGNIGYNIYGAASAARLSYFQNVGTNGYPAYKLITEDLGQISQFGFKLLHPALADMDDDGDVDLIVGDVEGNLHYLRNTGTNVSPSFSMVESYFQNIDVGEEAHPQIIDMNGDYLYDLVIGDAYGRIYYHENSGSLTNYNFSSTPTISQMGGISLYSSLRGKTTAFFSNKIDSTNKLYLFASSSKGKINVYGPITDLFGTYTLSDSIVLEATETSIYGANLTGDFRHELIVGQRTGGLYFLKRTKDIPVGIDAEPTNSSNGMRIHPNPNSGMAQLSLKTLTAGEVSIVVMNLSGKIMFEMHSQHNGMINENIDLRDCPAGIYFVSMLVNDEIHWGRLIKE